MKLTIEVGQLFSNCQHRLRHASLYLRHIMTSAYIATSEEYVTSSHILSKYFELVFLQLHLVQILFTLIII